MNNVEKESNSEEIEAVKRSSRTAKKTNVEKNNSTQEENGKTKEVELVRRSSRRRSIDGHKKKASASRK